MPFTRPAVAALAISAAFALAGCASPNGAASEGPTARDASERPAPSASTSVGIPAAFSFTAPTLAGGIFDGASLYGTATILWFWAPWCGSCAADAKYVLAAVPDLPKGVQILGVPTFSEDASMHDFADALGVNALTNIVDEDGSIALAFNMPALPSAAVIYPDGSIYTIPGSLSTASILEIARKLAP